MQYYLKRFNNTKGEIRKTWQLIKKLKKSTQNPESVINELKVNNKVVTDQTEIAHKFKKYFINIGSNLAGKVEQDKGSPLESLGQHGQNQPHSMFILPTDENEVKLIVRELSPNKSAGRHDILPKIVNAVINSIALQFVNGFNKSLLCGIFSNELKVAKVYPVDQCDDRLTISNYCPISVLPVVSKILKKLCLNEFQLLINKTCYLKISLSSEKDYQLISFTKINQ